MAHFDYSTDGKLLEFTFSNQIIQNNDRRLGTILKNKCQNKEKFYGIEISANSEKILNLKKFEHQPAFISIVWLPDVVPYNDIAEIAPIKILDKLKPNIISLLHLTCYEMTKTKLKNYLSLTNYSNIFALRGDTVLDRQEFQHTIDLIKEIRNIRNDSISIAVAGYPEVHPEANSKEDDLKHLKMKIDAGSDFIITQICFSSEKIKEFIRNCRSMGIKIPILPGIYIPISYPALKYVCEGSKIRVQNDLWDKYKKFRNNDDEFRNFAIQHAINTVNNLFNCGLDIHGVQFFTINNFDILEDVINSVF